VTVEIYLPLLLPVLVAVGARWTAEHARPAVAVRGLVTAAVVAAIASVWSLIMLAMTGLDDLPPLAGRDRSQPVPDAIAVLAIGALAWGTVRLLRDVHRRHDTARRLRAAGAPSDGLVVADWTAPLAVAVPGRPGHLLVTTGMLRGLDAHERRAVLAHERAHLQHRHHLAVAWVAAAASVNPLLRPVRETVTYLVERWADEEAATAVADRGLVARAVARAALATAGTGPRAGPSTGTVGRPRSGGCDDGRSGLPGGGCGRHRGLRRARPRLDRLTAARARRPPASVPACGRPHRVRVTPDRRPDSAR
jgi:Zn-dependent protease with chaperone function